MWTIYIYIYKYTYTHICIDTLYLHDIYTYIYIYVCTCVYIYICTCIYIRATTRYIGRKGVAWEPSRMSPRDAFAETLPCVERQTCPRTVTRQNSRHFWRVSHVSINLTRGCLKDCPASNAIPVQNETRAQSADSSYSSSLLVSSQELSDTKVYEP